MNTERALGLRAPRRSAEYRFWVYCEFRLGRTMEEMQEKTGYTKYVLQCIRAGSWSGLIEFGVDGRTGQPMTDEQWERGNGVKVRPGIPAAVAPRLGRLKRKLRLDSEMAFDGSVSASFAASYLARQGPVPESVPGVYPTEAPG